MLTKTWTDKEREVLIDEVSKRPELYNNAHPEFKNKERRAQAFDDIAHLIVSVSENPEQSVDGRTVSAQWKILKDSFNRTRKAAANSKTYNVPVWRFYRQMEFLVPYTTRYDHFTSSPTPAPPVNSLPNSSSTHYSDTSGDLDDDDVDDVRSKSSSNHDDHFVLQSPDQKVVLNSGQSSSHGDERHIEVHTPNGSHEVHGPHFLAASSSFHYKDRFNQDPEDFSLSSITPTTHISNHILLSTIDQPRKRPHQEICIPTTALVSHGSASASSTNSSSASVPFTTTGNLEDYVVDVVKRRVFDSREDDFDLFGRLVASAVREVAHFDQKMFLEMRREINEVVYKFEKKRFG